MELHENMIAPVYKQSHSNLQFKPCSSSHANGDSEPPYNAEGDYHYDSFSRAVVSTTYVYAETQMNSTNTQRMRCLISDYQPIEYVSTQWLGNQLSLPIEYVSTVGMLVLQ